MHAPADWSPVPWMLPTTVLQTIAAMARAEQSEPQVIALRLLERGIAEQGLTTTGRCSVRTGLCSQGPTPLALQQENTAD